MTSKNAIIITGATGWLGKCAIQYFQSKSEFEDVDLILFASSDKDFLFNNRKFKVHNFLNDDFEIFQNKVILGIVHLAFLTREKVAFVGYENYFKINTQITTRLRQFLRDFQPEWATTVSSGAINLDDADKLKNPYGFLKLEEEKVLRNHTHSKWSIGRLWGAMGFNMPINRNYAISDFVIQGLQNGLIEIRSPNLVFRRYVSDREFIETCIQSAILGKNTIFDSGGDLIEMRGLAGLVASNLGNVEIISKSPSGNADEYYPRGNGYTNIRHDLEYSQEIGIKELVKQTVLGHKKQFLR